ncbi:hypothetical protein BP5796_03274 [Coleophoma crateriformis]|uniref:Uncharacterized protein n=1 Tax=Coleophoma crateriformis TaxID=565419 RepID=A0A3D8SMP6_9HELO|nr:hypothetical protein BP5796_03274 [Coleophoma crateriformis]
MALAPKFAGQKFSAASSSQTLHTLELYLDYVCPFSAKMFNTVYSSVFPLLKSNAKYSNSVQFIFRQQIQPWHPSSTLVHEAGVAVLKLSPQLFWPFSAALFADQKSYFDVNIVNETRNATYARLAKLGASVGVDESKMYDLLKISDKPREDGALNTGNGTTDDLKKLVKYNRSTGIHVTPTVVFDGLVENGISSSFSAEQWDEWLAKNIV